MTASSASDQVILLILMNLALFPVVVFGMDASLGARCVGAEVRPCYVQYCCLPCLTVGAGKSGQPAVAAVPASKNGASQPMPEAGVPSLSVTAAAAPKLLGTAADALSAVAKPKSFLSDRLVVAGVCVFIFLNGVAKGVLTLSA